MTLTLSLKTFKGLSFDTAAQKTIDVLHVDFRHFGAVRSELTVPVIARNPFMDYTSVRVGSLMEDYTLFQFPDNDYDWDASAYWSAHTYADTQSYTMPVPRDQREKELSQSGFYPRLREVLYPRLRTVRFDFFLHRRGMVKESVQTTELDTTYMKGVAALKDRDCACRAPSSLFSRDCTSVQTARAWRWHGAVSTDSA